MYICIFSFVLDVYVYNIHMHIYIYTFYYISISICTYVLKPWFLSGCSNCISGCGATDPTDPGRRNCSKPWKGERQGGTGGTLYTSRSFIHIYREYASIIFLKSLSI